MPCPIATSLCCCFSCSKQLSMPGWTFIRPRPNAAGPSKLDTPKLWIASYPSYDVPIQKDPKGAERTCNKASNLSRCCWLKSWRKLRSRCSTVMARSRPCRLCRISLKTSKNITKHVEAQSLVILMSEYNEDNTRKPSLSIEDCPFRHLEAFRVRLAPFASASETKDQRLESQWKVARFASSMLEAKITCDETIQQKSIQVRLIVLIPATFKSI